MLIAAILEGSSSLLLLSFLIPLSSAHSLNPLIVLSPPCFSLFLHPLFIPSFLLPLPLHPSHLHASARLLSLIRCPPPPSLLLHPCRPHPSPIHLSFLFTSSFTFSLFSSPPSSLIPRSAQLSPAFPAFLISSSSSSPVAPSSTNQRQSCGNTATVVDWLKLFNFLQPSASRVTPTSG